MISNEIEISLEELVVKQIIFRVHDRTFEFDNFQLIWSWKKTNKLEKGQLYLIWTYFTNRKI